MHLNETNPEVVKRLKRAHGHLAGVIAMLEDQRECIDVAQQLRAVEKALGNAKQALIHHHLDHCLEHVAEGGKAAQQAVDQFKEITKYL